MAPPFKTCEFDIIFDEGISKLEQAIIDMFFDGKIELKENIKSLCTLTVPVRVYPEIVATPS